MPDIVNTNIIQHGTPVTWGVPEVENAALVVSSLSFANATKKSELTNQMGQITTVVYYDQSATFSMEAYQLAGVALTGYDLAAQVALNNFDPAANFAAGLGAGGASAATAVLDSCDNSMTAEGAQSRSYSGSVYNFATPTT